MPEQASQPTNKNFLSPSGFRFTLNRTPNINYFCKAATVPDLSIGRADVPTPFSTMPQPADKLLFGDMSITFNIDEDMANYREIFDWMSALAYPENFNQRKELKRTQTDLGGVFSDATLIIMTSSYSPNVKIDYKDLYPIGLSGVEFDLDQSDVTYLQATATFAYKYFNVATV